MDAINQAYKLFVTYFRKTVVLDYILDYTLFEEKSFYKCAILQIRLLYLYLKNHFA